MSERFAQVETLRLCYETFGSREDPAVLLVMGLGSQMINWDSAFCGLLVDRGFHVIRYDNRDCGRSSTLDDEGAPTLEALLSGSLKAVPYTLDDMAADAAGLLEALDIAAAHVVGASMGGMIAQCLAINHPERVRSLCSIMSTTGARGVGQPHEDVRWVLAERAPQTPEGVSDHAVRIWRAIGSPGFALDEQRLRDRARLSLERGVSPAGYVRQLAAIASAPDRTAALGGVRVPTLVIHGSADPLVDVSGGVATAEAVPGARIELFEGMGHDLPRELWPTIADAIAANAAAAERNTVA